MKDNTLARTPPMGWNSWNTFRCYELTEQVVLGIADAMVDSGMRDAGYEYLVVDDCWQAFGRDASGRLQAHPERFPNGMEALGEQIHARGLKYGLYLSPGRRTCAMIYDKYPARDIGSFEHERLDITTFAEWGVDYLKYDWCEADRGGTGLTYPLAFARMAEVIAASGRPIVYSISEYGRTEPWKWAGELGHLWRTTPDIGASWSSIMKIIDRQAGLESFAGPSGWNDPDMLEVGNSGLTAVESRTHFSLWALLAAPLMAGNDLRIMSASTRDILTNPGLLSVSQDPLGQQGRRIARHGKVDSWERNLAQGTAHGVLNRGSRPMEITVADDAIMIGADAPIMMVGPNLVDVWTGKALAAGARRRLEPHEMLVLRSDAR